MHTGCNAQAGCGAARQSSHQRGMFGLAAHGSPVFAIQGDVKHAGTKLLCHLRLQLQAFLHAGRRTTVVVAHRQHRALACLGTQQDVTRVLRS